MKFSVAAIVSASLAGFAAAQTCSTKPVGDNPSGNPISAPLNQVVNAGTPFTITWTPTTTGTVSIVLLRGPSTNVLPIGCLADNIANTGQFVWTPSSSLEADVTRYGIQIIVSGTGQYQYSTQFGIANDVVHQPSSVPPTTEQSTVALATQIGDGQVQAPTNPPSTPTIIPAVLNTTTASSAAGYTPPSSFSDLIVGTTHVPIHAPSGSGAIPALPTLQPTKNMTIPASLQTSQTYLNAPTKVTTSASASLISSSASSTGSPIASVTPFGSGAGKVRTGSILMGLGAIAAFIL
ncbi:MAG: hypothetical protein Q9211_005563 [Gyalolechia sp. 1 TL-2023]